MTTEDYLSTTESLLPRELIHSVCREAAAPTPRHQELVGLFFLALTDEVRQHQSGRVWMSPIDVVLDRARNLVVQPDLIVISPARLGIVADRVWGAPDLVVEVLSPEPRIGSTGERLQWFAEHGVRECWLVHQLLREVEVVRFDEGREASRSIFEADQPIRSSVLPDFNRTFAGVTAYP